MNQSVLNNIKTVAAKQEFKTREEVNGFLLELYPFEFSHASAQDKEVIYNACNL